MNISGKTRLFGVIGNPIEHSLSPAMHNAAFAQLKLDCVFLAFEVESAEVENAMHGVRGLGICGLNVTMPHKQAVIPFLDEVDETARFLNSVNTIQNVNGKLCGFSTDGAGALNAFRKNGADPKGKKVLLLGAGGAAKAIAYALAKETKQLTILNRTPKKTEELAQTLSSRFHTNVACGDLSQSALRSSLQDADILINATSVGMHPNSHLTLVSREMLKTDLTVMDIIYNPVETRLAKEAKAAGAKVISGVEMLIYQGAASFEIWRGQRAPVEVMRQAALSQLSKAGATE